MPLLHLILVIVAVGVILWAVNTYVPMQPGVRSILNGTVCVVLVLWVLSALGVFGLLRGVTVGGP